MLGCSNRPFRGAVTCRVKLPTRLFSDLRRGAGAAGRTTPRHSASIASSLSGSGAFARWQGAHEACLVHHLDDVLRLPLHLPGEVRVHDVPALHRRSERPRIEDVAFDDGGAARVGVLEPARAAEVQRRLRVGVPQEDARRGACQLSVLVQFPR